MSSVSSFEAIESLGLSNYNVNVRTFKNVFYPLQLLAFLRFKSIYFMLFLKTQVAF